MPSLTYHDISYLLPMLTNSKDLTSSALGGRIVSVSDEWFAEASNLLNPKKPIHIPGKVVYTGGWYDGWETRRHNKQTFDYAIVRMGPAAGTITGAEVDTAFFNGNEAPAISIEGCNAENDEDVIGWGRERGGWETILGRQECGPNRRQGWKLKSPTEKSYSYIRLNMYPDGGIARFRLFGHAIPAFPEKKSALVDLAAAINGGVILSCSDQHFSSASYLLIPGRGKDMSDGWETKRSRVEGHVDWVVVRLGFRGTVSKIVVDTAHFRGNFPSELQVEGIDWTAQGEPPADSKDWQDLTGLQEGEGDKQLGYPCAVQTPLTHVKLTIIPDGGVKRIRAFGQRI